MLSYCGHVLTSGVMELPMCMLPLYTVLFLNLEGNILKEFQLPHHHSISLVLLIPHLVTKAQLQ